MSRICVTHQFRATGLCPVNGQADHYEVEITVVRASPAECPMVEDISAVVVDLLSAPITQEQFTSALSKRMMVGVVTKGRHGLIDTVCTCYCPT